MSPQSLIKGATYSFTPEGKEPITLVYKHETLNHWAFSAPGINEMILLQKHQIRDLIKL